MVLSDIVSYIESKTSSGATLDEVKNHFDDTDVDELKRLINSGVLLDYLKKDGIGRGLRYYGFKYEIVKITSSGSPYINKENKNVIDGNIDVSDCLTVKDKIAKVLASTHPLSRPIVLSYRERLVDKPSPILINFIKDGYRDVDVKIIYDNIKKRNYIYSRKETISHNSLWIGYDDNGNIIIKQQFGNSPNNPEILTFQNWTEFEKCIKHVTK